MRRAFIVVLISSGLLALPAFAGIAGAAATSGTRLAAAPLAATGCQLTAVAHVAQDVVATGRGFAAAATIKITTVWSGSSAIAGGPIAGTTRTQTVTTDASGGFEFTVPAGPGRGGRYTFTATDDNCSATVQATAVETAGGLAPTPPATDTAAAPVKAPAVPTALLVAIVLGIGLLALAALVLRSRLA